MFLTLNDIDIIKAMMDKKTGRGFSKSYGSTVQDIHEATELSISKIRSSLNKFKNMQWIAEGVKDKKTKCYYVTEEGIAGLQDLTVTTDSLGD